MNISLKGKEGEKKTPLIVDYNQVIMFYHTVLRNMGLYTSIGVSILVFTRLFKDKNLYLNFLFMTLGLVFLSIGSYLSYYLIDELTSKKDRFNENAIFLTWYCCKPILGSIHSFIIFSGVSSATFSISTPPSVDAIITLTPVDRSKRIPR